MNTDGHLTLLVALCCIAALGVSATTLHSSTSTKPSDVVHLAQTGLPVGQGELASLKHRVTSGSTGPTDSTGGHDAASQASDGGGGERSSARSAQSARSSGGGQGSSPDGALSMIYAWLTRLLALAFLAALALAVGLAVRYRERLRALLTDEDPPAESDPDPAGGTDEPWPYDAAESNPVYSAWAEMVSLAGLSERRSMTPGECASAAVSRGLDAGAVRTLTREFEAVRYGRAAVTAERERRVRETRQRLGSGSASRSDGSERR